MKKVFFIRHAKSSWTDPSLRDFDRPLNKRGERDAPFMAKLLKGKLPELDLIVSSPANRALTTAQYFAEAFGIKKEEIHTDNQLYHAYPDDILKIIRALDDQYKVILLFGHNPGFTELANIFTEDFIDNVPTCGIFEVDAPVDSWGDFNRETARLVAFHHPKQYFS